jgi:serine/threonine protein kinase
VIAGEYNVIALSYIEQVESAKTPADLFSDAEKARSTYRRLARVLHPDTNGGDPRAVDAFAKLSDFWAQHNGSAPTPRVAGAPKTSGIVYQTKRRDYTVGDLIARGDISNVYAVTSPSDDPASTRIHTAVLKMPRQPKNSDLVENEIRVLKELKDKVPERYHMYHSKTVDSFAHKDPTTGKTRRSIILKDLPGFVSLREVIDAYPLGISGRHVAWIARRLWIAMDTAHEAGIIHGAVLPEHIMIHPTDHGLVLVDWSYARAKGEKLKAAVPFYRNLGWYGSSIDRPLDHRLDVRQAAYTLETLLGTQDARPFRAFFNGCRVASAPTAGTLYQEFEELLTNVYGERKYVPLTMPKGWKRAV